MSFPLTDDNPVLQQLPPHLKQFIKPQDYDDYTPINQAVWRYVMRKNVRYLSKIAHSSYLSGLQQTGISIEAIPSMYGMNRILKEIGWAAVAVDGFIPPNAFMEFQAYKVLVIASDIRQLEHIEYTPAPDIIHEAAGHAPIIANPDYAEYLRRLGAIGAKAILSRHDIDLYEAVRKLSILKEAVGSSPADLEEAAAEVDRLQKMEVSFSEMAKIRNLQWWTVEYGLIGTIEDHRIYGAGLLSSIGESTSCMKEDVTKLPYSVEAAERGFDITRPQPHLFVTPDFPYLMEVLEEFADTLSVRRGGHLGLARLIESGMVGTIQLSTGLQISGRFTRMITNDENEVIFFKTEGPSALAVREKELIGHGTTRYPKGVCSPLGELKGIHLAIEDMGPIDLKAYNFYDGKHFVFEFSSGIRVEGLNVTGIRNIQGKLIIIQLTECTVTYMDEVLYRPEQGVFDMAIGKSIQSAFAGAADFRSYPNLYEESKTKTIRPAGSAVQSAIEKMYGSIRQMRTADQNDTTQLRQMIKSVLNSHPEHWLLLLEILELVEDQELVQEISMQLDAISSENHHLKTLIDDGLKMIEENKARQSSS